ncbi:AAA family ATPase [Desulforhopalus vacuolatus]|uniref:ExeA family protein n=1 Tax=Desulforhopalus vacuolatus TaxID=40414 RepID=UPI001965D83A|nr:AAA family ATPase [Desulforhopalus vacuolatus]MBM9519294.1 AAA family ATPase [Desulforhopalus vacuolatus]
MYDSYFNLKEKAFEARPNRDFLWNGESRRVVVEAFCEGIYEKNGFQMLIGEEGVGKTTVLQMVLDEVQEEATTLCISHIPNGMVEFYNSILSGFGLQKEAFTRLQFMMELSKLLKEVHEKGRIALLVIDNAEGLRQEFFEELRTLIGLEKDGRRLLNLLLVGRSPLISLLDQPDNRILRQKMAWHAELKPLNEIETREYIEYRLQAAGCNEPVFAEGCFPLLHTYSGGQPARLNELCTAVLSEAAEQNAVLTPEFITFCALQGEFPEPLAFQQDVAESTEAPQDASEQESFAQAPAEEQPAPHIESTSSVAAAEAVSAVGGQWEDEEAISTEKAEAEEDKDKEPFVPLDDQHSSDLWLTHALRGFIALALCLGLYFLYDKIFTPTIDLQVPLDDSPVTEFPLSQADTVESSQEIPLVLPNRPAGNLEPLRTDELKEPDPIPTGYGKIEVYLLEYIDN